MFLCIDTEDHKQTMDVIGRFNFSKRLTHLNFPRQGDVSSCGIYLIQSLVQIATSEEGFNSLPRVNCNVSTESVRWFRDLFYKIRVGLENPLGKIIITIMCSILNVLTYLF